MGSFNLDRLVRPNIRKLKAYSSARGEFYNNGLNRYPDPEHKVLKAKLSEIKNISEAHILLGNGSDELISLLFKNHINQRFSAQCKCYFRSL